MPKNNHWATNQSAEKMYALRFIMIINYFNCFITLHYVSNQLLPVLSWCRFGCTYRSYPKLAYGSIHLKSNIQSKTAGLNIAQPSISEHQLRTIFCVILGRDFWRTGFWCSGEIFQLYRFYTFGALFWALGPRPASNKDETNILWLICIF